jgi:hypothetical protein
LNQKNEDARKEYGTIRKRALSEMAGIEQNSCVHIEYEQFFPSVLLFYSAY